MVALRTVSGEKSSSPKQKRQVHEGAGLCSRFSCAADRCNELFAGPVTSRRSLISSSQTHSEQIEPLWTTRMARHESDREDMIREATALRNRIEWQLPSESEPVFAGVRSEGSLSVYFGPDPVYQFSPAGGLRRAYSGGFLYRTQGTTLARLRRARSTEQTILLRADLDEDVLAQFLCKMDERLD